jgi:hypothetical protein
MVLLVSRRLPHVGLAMTLPGVEIIDVAFKSSPWDHCPTSYDTLELQPLSRLVGSPGGFSPPGSHGTERDSLPSFRSSHPLQSNARVRFQWMNSSGS